MIDIKESEDGASGQSKLAEEDIVYDATMGALTGVRRIFILLSGLFGLYLFNMFLWYCGWDHARIAAREGILLVQESMVEEGQVYTDEDKKFREKTENEIQSLRNSLTNQHYEVPLLKIPVSVNDYPVAILLTTAALLLWLLYFQRRFGACLRKLARMKGSGIVLSALQYHFLLIGKHSSPDGRLAAKGLIYGLPTLGMIQLGSDAFDVYQLWKTPIVTLAFGHSEFVMRTAIRLGLDFLLVLAVGVLSYRCYREYKDVEHHLTQFLRN
ncbi:MAG TPA: hypothetical protein VF789_11135 [Thermoanaerobaculia bacterium]